MNDRSRFARKMLYVLAALAMLFPLYLLSAPGVLNKDKQLARGGKLAEIRHKAKLSQADLGEIDPAGETMKLATLGLKNVAVNILWSRARDYQMKENWTQLSATLEQLSRLVPNYVSVWQFQAWNLSYNVSVEFDDYRDRYRWVIRGINFLKDGTVYNANNPPLLWDMGWTISQKIGRADEHLQFRRMFKKDDEFHGPRPLPDRDNWLVGKTWFEKAEHVVDNLGVAISGLNPMYDTRPDGQKRGKSPLIFYSDAPKCQMNYAEAMEEEGTFGEVARNAWKKAGELWTTYGNREILSTFNEKILLNDKERKEASSKQAVEKLEALLPKDEREKARQEKIAKLTNREKIALNLDPAKRTPEQQTLMYTVDEKIKVTPSDLANRVPEAKRSEALALADQAMRDEDVAGIIDRYRQIVNFEYWRLRCNVEQTEEAAAGRRLLYQADLAFEPGGRIAESAELFEEGFKKWRVVLDKYPLLLSENTMTEDLADYIKTYIRVLGHLERKLPEDFILKDVIEHAQEFMNEPPPYDQSKKNEEELKERGAEEKSGS